MDFTAQFKNAARVSTPIVGIRTFDAKSTTDNVRKLKVCAHHLLWDSVNGIRPCTDEDAPVLSEAIQAVGVMSTVALSEALRVAVKLEPNSLMFVSNVQLYWEEAEVIQGIWNLRDICKGRGSMLVLLMLPGAVLPKELQNDAMILDEPLPEVTDLEKIILKNYEAATKKNKTIGKPSAEVLSKGTAALIGLPAFPADQSTAMCLDIETGKLDIEELRHRKKQIISQVQGLTFLKSATKFANLGGAENWKSFFSAYMNGKARPNVILRMDEGEKLFAGSGTDTSGSKTELTGAFLSWTSEKKIAGTVSVGVPGSGKTESIYALGNEFDIPVIDFNIAAMQDKFVGNTGANFRAATAAIDAISDGKILIIMTSNGMATLPPELRSRFKLGIFFWDAPDSKAKRAIWDIYRERYEIPKTQQTPKDTVWTGREIEECCSKAYVLGITLQEAAKYVVPVMTFAQDEMTSLRESAAGKYISADHEGTYQYRKLADVAAMESEQDRVMK